MAHRVNHQEIVKKLIETKAIDFHAIGSTFAEVAPAPVIPCWHACHPSVITHAPVLRRRLSVAV